VIVHIAGTTPDEVARCVERLEEAGNVAGVELGLDDGTGEDAARQLISAAAHSGGLPVLARLPLLEAERLCRAAAERAAALVVGGPPRGTLRLPGGAWLTGRIYSRALFPLGLRAMQMVANLVDVPLIGAGGIETLEEAQAMLAAGAVAVEVDAAVWRDPRVLEQIALGLTRNA
jgi:dihydroorotate dehydrogenase (NAD+) catalytic subunit